MRVSRSVVRETALLVLTSVLAAPALASLPPVPVPPQNPITEPKRVLGKILFWDEQLSTSNVVACATCHQPARGGTDPRVARNRGPDGALNTPDDILASPGVIRSNANNDYQRDAVFGLAPQITSRAANPSINAAYFTDLFWDGRARSQFVDPQTGAVIIPAGGALESQAVGPPLSSVEMAHDAMAWNEMAARLQGVNPLDLATTLPPDVAAVLAGKPSYPELFEAAFGDSAITAARIGMAIATYERTLISDQSPWDAFQAGNTAALTPNQVQGMNAFDARACVICHAPPLFSDNTFRNIGVRPPVEDIGRQAVTGLALDLAKFKVPSLRNAGLKATMAHNGQFPSVNAILGFYAGAPGVPPGAPTRQNRDPLMDTFTNLPPQVAGQIADFIINGLTDPRVANAQFPFDKPLLFTERPANANTLLGGGVAGSGGIVPRVIVQAPALVGSSEFRVGLDQALGGATAVLQLSANPPLNGRITPTMTLGTVNASGAGAGTGVATVRWTIDPALFQGGDVAFVQWFITDGAAAGGQALSNVARLNFFCGSYGCPAVKCNLADVTNVGGDGEPDGQLSLDDILLFVNAYNEGDGCPGTPGAACNTADVTDIGHTGAGADGLLTLDDILAFVDAYNEGC